MSTAHVVQCNDMVVCVVIGSEEEANARVEVERQAYFDKNPHDWVIFRSEHWNQLSPQQQRELHWKAYKERIYWRAHEAPLY